MKNHRITPLERAALAASDAACILLLSCGAAGAAGYVLGNPAFVQVCIVLAAVCVVVVVFSGHVAVQEGGWPGRLALIAAFGAAVVFAALMAPLRRRR